MTSSDIKGTMMELEDSEGAATENTKRRAPISLDDLLASKRRIAEESAKPKFLTREERAAIALQRRAEQVERQKAALLAARSVSNLWDGERGESAHGSKSNPREDNRYGREGRSSRDYSGRNDHLYDHKGDRARRDDRHKREERNGRDSGDYLKHTSHEGYSKSGADNLGGSAELAPEELEAIRARHLGTQRETVKKKKRSQDKKFVFDWDQSDDTSTDVNPVYANPHQYRGKLGGYDERKAEEKRVTDLVHLLRKGSAEDKERARQLTENIERRKQRVNWDDIPWYEKPLEMMKERDWRIFKEEFQIVSKGGRLPNPMRNWGESGLPSMILEVIHKVGYKEPSPIQRASIPIGIQNRDLIGIAETGSGKTAAFIIPALVYISDLPPMTSANKNDGPYAIVLAPTRELAQQIESEAAKFATPLGFRVVSIVGGHVIEEQAQKVSEGAHIVIATPGRLIDCLERRLLVLNQCTHVTMDEADRMIDMGFEESVNKILNALPVRNAKPDSDAAEDSIQMSKLIAGKERFRQTIMFSATFPPSLEKIAQTYLRRPAIITIGNPGQATDRIEQRVEMFMDSNEERREEKRRRRLDEILSSGRYDPPVIIFVNTKRNCDLLSRHLAKLDWNAVTLHGGKSQEQRESALTRLRSGEADCLVATDLAGRGIDVADVSLVLNYNMAKTIEDYTHRIGRTGRAGKFGVAITFLGPDDQESFYDLKQMITKSPISKVPEELRRHEASQHKGGRKEIKKSTEEMLLQAG